MAGPELTRIGEIRTRARFTGIDSLSELSFVQTYEPVLVVTIDGRTINGTIRDETDKQ